MQMILRALVLILALLPAVGAAQQFPTVPDRTVIGRVGTGSGSGPSQAIPFTSLPTLFGAPSIPVIHPSSGNDVGAGCATNHQLWWVDQNFCSTADVFTLTSSDPSALNRITVTGTPANGTLTVTLKFSAQTFNIPVTVTNVMTTTQVAAAIVTAIHAAGTSVYNNVAGAQGQILYITSGANVVSYDANSALVSTTIAYTAGTTALTLTFQAGENTTSHDYALATAWDNNPVRNDGRIVCGVLASNGTTCTSGGVAPASGSQLTAWNSSSSTSTDPNHVSQTYGTIVNNVVNSTSGAIAGRWSIVTPDTTGALNQGVYVGSGVYTVGTTDKGIDTVNAKQLWVSGTEELVLSGSDFAMIAGAAHNIQLAPATGQVAVAAAGVDTSMQITGDVAKNQVVAWKDSAIRWQAYKPSSSTDLRFFDGTADRVKFINGGVVQVTTGGLTVGDTGSPASGIISAATGYRIANGAAAAGTFLRGNATNFIASSLTIPDSGTSGGIPYYSSGSAISSSAALAANDIVVGGGAGVAPATGTGCSIVNQSVRCTSSSSAFPQFQLTNTTADANSPAFIFQKNRSGGDTQSGDCGVDQQVQMFANSGQRITGRFQVCQTGASSGSNIPSKAVISTSNTAGQINQSWTFDSAGHQSIVQATAPTITAGCSGAGSAITGNDTYGTVTGSTAAVTTCTITFGTAYAATPHCVASGLSSPLTGAITPATGTLVVNFASTANFKFTYQCYGA